MLTTYPVTLPVTHPYKNRNESQRLMLNCSTMKQPLRLFRLLLFITTLLFDSSTLLVGAERRVIVSYKGDDDSFLAKALTYALSNKLNVNITARNLLSITIQDDSVLARLLEDEDVEYVEEDNLVKASQYGETTTASASDSQTTPYGIEMVNANLIWDKPIEEVVKVCVVDTGIDLGHPDLPKGIEDEVRGTSTDMGDWHVDVQGHGTHCAGTIGAEDNGIGVVGVNPNATLFRFHIGKGLSDDGSGYESAILGAVQGCVDAGAKVISMSLGGPFPSRSSRKFYEDMWDQGILVIAAAGNDGDTGHAYPASYEGVMSVAAVDKRQKRADFSQCNSQVEIAAPGVDILSTTPGGYGYLSGTSMACPHVAGVAALVWSRFPNCTNAQIRNVFIKTANHVGKLEGCTQGYGWGLLDANASYNMLLEEGCEAGGWASQYPIGGCPQMPGYNSKDNPNQDECPVEPKGLVWWTILLIVIGVLLVAVVTSRDYWVKKCACFCNNKGGATGPEPAMKPEEEVEAETEAKPKEEEGAP